MTRQPMASTVSLHLPLADSPGAQNIESISGVGESLNLHVFRDISSSWADGKYKDRNMNTVKETATNEDDVEGGILSIPQ